MIEVLQFEFMRNALYAGLLASVACGIIGTLVVVNRIVFISGGIAHAAYGGVGIAFYFGLAPLVGIGGFSLVIAAIMAAVTVHSRHRSDTVIGALWAFGMALGVLLIDITPGYNVDLMSYLFGSILTVPKSDLWLMLILDLVILATVILFYKDFLAISFDEEFATAMGVPAKALYFALLAMIALVVVMIVRVVGLILVIALLSIPAYISEKYSESMRSMMILSIMFSCLFVMLGLGLAYSFNITSGATIIMVAAALFFIHPLFARLANKKQ